ncbi:probable histone-lysine n-methyltransferase atxr5 [Phtheirospermum japonicum]|uniref:[histone H3]-lysine(27) N-methyltransferase n=1 Tax=Phtheirospermum japonicum TaxID=374723 RepID=A0A830CZU7_9LAMI|nr:probable histone-lysine n-methyltransferase atxr5 [Phtheirospermum japonicum]
MAPSSIPAAQQGQPQLGAAEPMKRGRKKYRSMEEIMKVAKRVVALESEDEEELGGGDYYNRVACEQCGSGERDEELLLCDRCDRGYHMLCVRPIVARIPIGPWFCPVCSDDHNLPLKSFTQKKIADFFRIQKCGEFNQKCASRRDVKKRRRRSSTLVFHKKRRRLLPYIPSEDSARRLVQMGSLASALTAHSMDFSNELTYMPGLAPRSSNQAIFENGGMQILSKEDAETLERCKAMHRRGEYPPLIVIFDSCEGYTVEADGPIKDMTLIAEYTGDVDYMKNREQDDCDSMMTLLLATEESKSLLVCPDKRGNIARFISGINNHTPDGRKKQNIKCVRYSVDSECRVLLVAKRDIAKGERLYYDYNGYEHEYPTHNFV